MTGTWSTGWVDGDVPLVAEWPKKGIGAIFDTTLGVAAPAIDIVGIPQTYAHLWLWVYARGDYAAVNVGVFARLNNDAVTPYDYQKLAAFGAAASAAEAFSNTSWYVGNMPGDTGGAHLFNTGLVFLPNYANTANNKAFIALSAEKTGTTTGLQDVNVFGGGWRSNTAINQLTLLPGVGNFQVGTRVTAYAMGA